MRWQVSHREAFEGAFLRGFVQIAPVCTLPESYLMGSRVCVPGFLCLSSQGSSELVLAPDSHRPGEGWGGSLAPANALRSRGH